MLIPKQVALVFAQTAGIVYAVCALVVALAPNLAWKLVGWIAHVSDWGIVSRSMSFGSFLLGLIQILVYSYLGAWLFATLYNRATK